MFKLSKLAQDLLEIDTTTNFHDAQFDTNVLQKIANLIIPKNNFFMSRKLYSEAIINKMQSQTTATFITSLQFLKGTILEGMIKKIANSKIDYNKLKESYIENGKKGITLLLSERLDNGKPRVTENKKVLEKIQTFLSQNNI